MYEISLKLVNPDKPQNDITALASSTVEGIVDLLLCQINFLGTTESIINEIDKNISEFTQGSKYVMPPIKYDLKKVEEDNIEDLLWIANKCKHMLNVQPEKSP